MIWKKLLLLFCAVTSISLQAQRMENLDRLKEGGYNFWFYTPDTLALLTQSEPQVSESEMVTANIIPVTNDAVVLANNTKLVGNNSTPSAFDTIPFVDDSEIIADADEMMINAEAEKSESIKNAEVEEDEPAVEKKPLVVFLHGQSLCGGPDSKVLRYGTLDALRRGRKIDAYVVAPHNPGGRWDPNKIIDLVDWAIANYPIDSCRVYVLGMSLGGFGTINTAAAYPDRFAAAMALCGGGVNPSYENLNKLPLWILHGTSDRDVRIRESDEVVKGMKKAGKPVRLKYDRLKGKNHSILARIFYMPQTYEWLFSHSLNDTDRPICTDYKIDNSDFGTAYNNLHQPDWKSITFVNRKTQPDQEETRQGRRRGRHHSDDAPSGGSVYRVKQGDTLSGIAHRHHTSVRKLCRLNGIKETSTLSIGQKIRIQ